MFVVIMYDIPDNRRRTRLFKSLKRFGNAVQYSVFECELSHWQFKEVQRAVARIINTEEDHVRYYELCRACVGGARKLGPGAEVTTLPKTLVI